MRTEDRIDKILRHIKMVQNNLEILSEKIFKQDPIKNKIFVLELIKRSRAHDLSKFSNLEFENQFEKHDSKEFKKFLQHHHLNNSHHPEHYTHISKMSNIDIAEMVCDCLARSQEFGTDIRDWFYNTATYKYDFLMSDKVGLKITMYLDLLLSKSFS